MSNKKDRVQYGDFQTPLELARQTAAWTAGKYAAPPVVIEPTCGVGAFLIAAREAFPESKGIFGYEINQDYAEKAREQTRSFSEPAVCVEVRDFFADPPPVWKTPGALWLGNLPWVTNAGVARVSGDNLPQKSNFLKMNGLDALTGKSNFDIAEYMLLRLAPYAQAAGGRIGMLCKTATARSILRQCWKTRNAPGEAAIVLVDAKKEFDASVAACLFWMDFSIPARPDYAECAVYANLNAEEPERCIGWADGRLLADAPAYLRNRQMTRSRSLASDKWRSGVKHDCGKILELKETGGGWRNGAGDIADIEEERLFPLYKSADLLKADLPAVTRRMILPQLSPDEDTRQLALPFPKLWAYLNARKSAFEARKSKVYLNKPPFGVFGLGAYSFAPYKIAVSGFSKECRFHFVSPHEGKPVLFDDTCYFFAFDEEREARETFAFLNRESSREFLLSLLFRDAKRPVTADLLNALALPAFGAPAAPDLFSS